MSESWNSKKLFYDEKGKKMSKKIQKYKITKEDTNSTAAGREESSPLKKEVTKPSEENPTETSENQSKAIPEAENKEKSRAAKKKIIITVAICLLAFVALYYGITAVTAIIKQHKADQESAGTEHKIKFYTPNYDEDIRSDRIYMGLDRNFYFEDSAYGTRFSYDTETLDEVSETYRRTVAVITEYLLAAVDGDEERINSLFSETYYAKGYKNKPKMAPQKLYDIVIITEPNSYGIDIPSADETQFYWVEYKIRMNNGTFRNDMGSDGVKKELFAVSIRNGAGEIDAVIPYRTSG